MLGLVFVRQHEWCAFLSAMHAAAQMDIGQATDTPIETREPSLYQTVCGAERAGTFKKQAASLALSYILVVGPHSKAVHVVKCMFATLARSTANQRHGHDTANDR
jgi:hypothetical protein